MTTAQRRSGIKSSIFDATQLQELQLALHQRLDELLPDLERTVELYRPRPSSGPTWRERHAARRQVLIQLTENAAALSSGLAGLEVEGLNLLLPLGHHGVLEDLRGPLDAFIVQARRGIAVHRPRRGPRTSRRFALVVLLASLFKRHGLAISTPPTSAFHRTLRILCEAAEGGHPEDLGRQIGNYIRLSRPRRN